MVERITRVLVDDLDGTQIADGKGGAVEFALRGSVYRIDLTNANAAKLDKALAPFIAAAAKMSGPRNSTTRNRTTSNVTASAGPAGERTGAVSNVEVRAWAAANGHNVSARGRVPLSVVEAFQRARERSK